MKNSFILIPATVAILTGCKVGPNYRAPRSALPATYSHATSAAGAGKVAVRQLVASATLKNASTNRNSTLLTGNCLFTDDRNMGV